MVYIFFQFVGESTQQIESTKKNLEDDILPNEKHSELNMKVSFEVQGVPFRLSIFLIILFYLSNVRSHFNPKEFSVKMVQYQEEIFAVSTNQNFQAIKRFFF